MPFNITIIFIEADFVLHALLSNMIPVNDKGERFCLNLSIVDDTVGEDSEQFELYFEIIPSEFATVGTNDTVCITIPKNDGMYITIVLNSDMEENN